MANNVDPDQMPHSSASDLGLHCLLVPVYTVCLYLSVPIFKVITVNSIFTPENRDRRARANSVDSDLIRVYTVCLSYCSFKVHQHR